MAALRTELLWSDLHGNGTWLHPQRKWKQRNSHTLRSKSLGACSMILKSTDALCITTARKLRVTHDFRTRTLQNHNMYYSHTSSWSLCLCNTNHIVVLWVFVATAIQQVWSRKSAIQSIAAKNCSAECYPMVIVHHSLEDRLLKVANTICYINGPRALILPIENSLAAQFHSWLIRYLFYYYDHMWHVTPALQQLHWLPVEYRIKYKLCALMHQIHTGRAPQYLVDYVQSVAESSRRPGLRSANTADYVKRCTRTKFGQRCFSHAGPAAWNSLPASI